MIWKPVPGSTVHGYFRQTVLAALLAFSGVTAFTSASAALPELVPAVAPTSQEHHVGKVIFVELITPDLAQARQFYHQLFGWEFHEFDEHGVQYAEASLNGRPVAGMVQRSIAKGQTKQPAWLTFIAVRDVDGAKKTALDHGATVLFEPHDIPNRGREAVFADPQGAVFAVLASSSGDPADEAAAPGEWIWSSLITSDPESNAAFYQAVFDYEIFELPSNNGFQHLMFASDNYARASVNSLPQDRTLSRPHWLNYVNVDDAAATAEKVVSLGGKVLLQPRLDRHGGLVAVVADPSGAPFGLIEWKKSDTKEVAK